MKALLRKEWLTFIRGNIIHLSVLLIIYLFISSASWHSLVEIPLILYALAVSPVIMELKDYQNGWHTFEQFAWPYRQRVLCRCTISAGYSLAGGFIVFLLGKEILSALSAVLIIMAILSVCIPAVLHENSTGRAVTRSLAWTLAAMPLVMKLGTRVTYLQFSHAYGTVDVPPFEPVIFLLIPAVVVFFSILCTLKGSSD